MSRTPPGGRSRVPALAARILHEGTLCYLAVPTRHGPHLTPVVYLFHAGRLWVTTARRTVKARSWALDQHVSGMVRSGDLAVSFRGSVTAYDALDPLTWAGALAGAPRLVNAATRFSLKNARFFAGYAVDAGRVPLSWTPPGRIFAAIRPSSGHVMAESGPVGAWGEWRGGARYRRTFADRPAASGLDRGVPPEVLEELGEHGSGALALQAGSRLTVLPVAWRRAAAEGAYEAVLPAATLELAGAGPEAPAALTVDHASSWRAADMAGLLLQGEGRLHAPASTTRGKVALRERLGGRPDHTLVRLTPERIVWWRGWDSGTVVT